MNVRVLAGGAPLADLIVLRTERDGTGWRKLDVPIAAGPPEREFTFVVSSAEAGRPFAQDRADVGPALGDDARVMAQKRSLIEALQHLRRDALLRGGAAALGGVFMLTAVGAEVEFGVRRGRDVREFAQLLKQARQLVRRKR